MFILQMPMFIKITLFFYMFAHSQSQSATAQTECAIPPSRPPSNQGKI